jgi:hypothetical protein
MRLFACVALALMTLLGVAACSDTPGDAYDNTTHGGYPGPGTKTENRS